MNIFLRSFCIFLLSLAGISRGSAQNLSNKGTDFWVGYGHHQFMESGQNNSQEMVLYFSADQAANVRVTIDGTAYERTYNVPANSVIASEFIPKSGMYDARLITLGCTFVPDPATWACGGEGIFSKKGIHIESDVPIVAYAHIWGSASSGASMLMPVETWGYAYTTLNSKQNYQPNCFSWVYVIAQHDNTLIEITPAAKTRRGKLASVPFTVMLNKGQIYQTMAGPEGGSSKDEMTGTKVKSIDNGTGNCYPIAVFAGSSRTGNPLTCGSGGGDNDNQQCFPTQAWGKRYLTAPTSNSGTASNFMTNAYKIAVKIPGTVVRRNGTIIAPLPNETYYFESNQAELIEADNPIMVAQFMTGGPACQGGSGVGDPEMMYISPVEQGIKRIGFYRNSDEGISFNYLTLIIPTTGLASLLIDNSPTFTHTYPHPRLAGYTVVIKRWTASKSQAIAQSDEPFTAITYGLGSVESYGYNAGTLINNLSAIGEIQNTLDPSVPSHPFTCTNTPMKLSILTAYQPTKMVWKLSGLAGNLTPAVDVTDNAPVDLGTTVVNGITYYRYSLPGSYQFSQVGTFTVYVDCSHPSIERCDRTEELKFQVEVRGKPWTNFTSTHTGCVLDSAHFAGPSVSTNGYNIAKWNWTFPGLPATSTLQNPATLISATGAQNIRLQIISEEGCVGDTTKSIPVVNKPVANFTTTPAFICEGGTTSFTDGSNYTGSAPINSWYWDFGNGNVLNAPNAGAVSSPYPVYGTFTVKHVVAVSNTCPSDTVTKVVTVRAKPRPSFTYPAGCLPANGIVQFTNTTTVPDGQAIGAGGYAWDFGDPNATAANPNTSTAVSPTHFYSAFGNYTITLSATTVNGCTKDTIVNATFNLRPTLAYPALTSVCENVAGTVSVATASVTNAVPGAGVYVGPGTDAAGNFNPSVAGPGTHTIKYKYTTSAGCTDSISRTILVKARAVPNFSFPAGGCLPASGVVQFVNNTTTADGQTMTYAWDFDDPNATAGNPNTSTATAPSHIYLEGTYSIGLTITTSGGCISDTTITTPFSRKPSLAYPALSPTCQNETTPISVATASVTNGVAGTGIYYGPGTTSAGNFTPSIAGFGTHTIWYKFTTAGGCADSISRTIQVRAKPKANFTYTNTACLPTTGLVTLTNSSTIADGQTMTYAWNFDDPNATGSNPNTATTPVATHNFQEGTYNIVLTATTTPAGCIGDTTIAATFSVKPALTFPALAARCQNETAPVSIATATVTNAVTGTGIYSGPGTDAAGNFTPSVAGFGTHTIWYKFTTVGGCKDSVSQTIAVRAKPKANFGFTNPVCLPTTGLVTFTNSSSIADGQPLTYAWDFNDPNASGTNPNTSTATAPSHNFGEGTFGIHLTATTPAGCTGDTTINAVFSVKPALSFPALTSMCENETTPVSIASATVTNNVTGTGVYSGPGTTATGNFTPSVAGFGTHTIWYKFTTVGGCKDSVSQTISVRAKPRARFTFTNPTCLPTTGLVSFTNNSSVPDAQTLTYGWNFDDPNAGGSNPNTSTVPAPTHNFGEGTYDINLTATTNTGCVADTTITVTFSIKPAVAFTAPANRCESDDPVSIATGSVTNGVTGTGVYSGPGTNATGMFDPGAAGDGVHTIWYKFTTTGGCADSISRTIRVNPKPVSAFTITSDICLGTVATITNQSTIPSGTIRNWNWNFGDGNSVSNTNGNPFTKGYSTFGDYTVKLVTVSTDGCISDTTEKTIGVHAIPVADFDMPDFVCMPNGIVQFDNLSSSADNASLTYRWNFGDATPTSSAVSPTHAYSSINSYSITLRATSSFGCFKDTVQTFNAFYDKPIADFSVTPLNLCQGTPNVFTDNSTAPNSTIANWYWDFNDGTTSTEATPSKTYSQPGNYNITLTVKNAFGCTSDPFPKNVVVNLQPKVDAGQSFIVPQNTVIRFKPIVNDSAVVQFLWTPGFGLSNPTTLRPSITAIQNQTYTLTATGPGNCTASDTMYVKVLRPVIVPNAFSPNGDNIHERWDIEYLTDYPGVTVDVYNRYGQIIYKSIGYNTPWDGTMNGKPLPFATYYYIINLHNGFEPLTGSVTIVK